MRYHYGDKLSVYDNNLLCSIEVESYREMISSKDSDINELKSELKMNQDKLLALQLTTEKKASKDLGVQFDFTVPATGERDNHRFITFETEGKIYPKKSRIPGFYTVYIIYTHV